MLKTKCLPVLLYGIEAVKLTNHEMSRLENAFDRAFMKIFGTFDKTTIRQCQLYLGVLQLCYEID